MKLRPLGTTLALLLALAACNKKEGAAADTAATKPAASAAPQMATSADAIDNRVASGDLSANAPPQAIPAPPDVAAPPADAQKTASGLASKVLKPGTGKEHPGIADKVNVSYTGWTKGGQMFDSSTTHGGPVEFPVNGLIPGMTEGLQLMVAGEKRRLWIPSKLAYGDHPPMPGAPAGDIVFDVEMISIEKGTPPPPVPADVAAPPASATKTPSGLTYKILTPSKDPNAQKPTAASVVSVLYAGWTTDGKMFDYSQDGPATFPLNRVIKGWTEGVQLMKVGDKARFWIPGELAYDDPSRPSRPGVPHGMLVFDVTLVGIMGTPPQGGGAPQPK
jgi:peptidylprolyl isomerase